VCLLIALKVKDFLATYDNKLGNKRDDFTQEQKTTVLLSVVKLLRRHSSNHRLCCHDNENDLRVTDIDNYGFVTYVQCINIRCEQIMDTACYKAKRTYERIYDEKELKPGDHICWHRPYVIWHHAIVTNVEPAVEDTKKSKVKVTHYSIKCEVETEAAISSVSKPFCDWRNCKTCNEGCTGDGRCSSFNALYRVKYEDCYDAEYTILRANKLEGESRYDMLERNCEHVSHWCKTGSIKSAQVGIFWLSVGKSAVTAIAARILTLTVSLFLLQYPHEALEQRPAKCRNEMSQALLLLLIFLQLTSLLPSNTQSVLLSLHCLQYYRVFSVYLLSASMESCL